MDNLYRPDNIIPDPIFEPGPGWGKKIKNWLERNFYQKILPSLAVLVLLAGLAANYNYHGSDRQQEGRRFSLPLAADISVIVRTGDGIIRISRQALDQYLKNYPELAASLKPEHRLYVDNFFAGKFSGEKLTVGQEILFSLDDLRQATEEALNLPEGKLAKFRSYLPPNR